MMYGPSQMTRQDASDAVQAAMRARGLTFAALASELDRPLVWVAAAVPGQHPFSDADTLKLVGLLDLQPEVAALLVEVPIRGGLESPVPVDPTIYRLYEGLQGSRPALEDLHHEGFADGIMSAITFKIALDRVPDPAGDRVRITLDGKFLPYQWG